MDKESAKRILLAYRPGTPDGQDPEVAEALAAVEGDPECQGWLRDQASFHAQMRSALRQMSIPSDLREAILAGRKIVRPVWQRPEVWLAAACLVAALFVATLWVRPRFEDTSFAGFRSRMVGFALRVYRMDIETTDLNEVRQFLKSKGAPADYVLTPQLQATPVKGGASLTWQGHPVSMVCFRLPKDETLYMFVMDEKALAGHNTPGSRPVVREVGGVMTIGWKRDGKVYLIAAPPESEVFRTVLGVEYSSSCS